MLLFLVVCATRRDLFNQLNLGIPILFKIHNASWYYFLCVGFKDGSSQLELIAPSPLSLGNHNDFPPS